MSNPGTTIRFSISERSLVTIKIFDATGREVAKPLESWLAPGEHQARWEATGFANGVYFYRFQIGEKVVDTKKLISLN